AQEHAHRRARARRRRRRRPDRPRRRRAVVALNPQLMTNPARYLLPMALFLAVVGALAWLLRAPLERVFLTNPALSAAIRALLLIGVAQSFGRLGQLLPEIKWVELRKRPEASLAPEDPPTLLAPMAAMLGDRRGLSLSTASTRSLLDSVGARLEESR